MTTEKSVHIGTVLSFDEQSYLLTLEAWDRILDPVNEAITHYLSLNIGDLSKIDLKDFLTGNPANIEKLYRQSVDKTLKELKISVKAVVDSFRQNITNDMKEMTAKLLAAQKQMNEETKEGFHFAEYLTLLTVVNNKVILPEEAKPVIKQKFQITIETENQAEVYQLYLDAKAALQKLKDKAYSPFEFRFPFLGFPTSMLPVDGNGDINLVPTVMHLIK